MKKSLVIVKVGGKIVEQPETLERLLTDFKAIPGDKLLVHGGGRSATAMASRLGISASVIRRPSTILLSMPRRLAIAVAERPPP